MSGHDHSHAVPVGAGRERRLVIAILLNVGIVVAQIVAGFASGSLGLLADAGHNLTDVLAISVALVAVMLTRRPRTGQRSFGWHRATVLAALFNAASILAVCVFVVYESVERLRDPQPVEGGIVVGVRAPRRPVQRHRRLRRPRRLVRRQHARAPSCT